MNGSKALAPPKPDDLSPLELQLWGQTTQDLQALGLLTSAAADVVRDYVQAYALAIESGAKVREGGLVIETESGPRRNPQTKIAIKAWKKAGRLAGKLGLSPMSRARMGRAEV